MPSLNKRGGIASACNICACTKLGSTNTTYILRPCCLCALSYSIVSDYNEAIWGLCGGFILVSVTSDPGVVVLTGQADVMITAGGF